MKLFFTLITLLSFQIGISQTSNPSVKIETNSAESDKPKPESGINAFYKYISENFRVPENENFVGGKMVVTFVVETDGSLNEIEVIKDLGFGTDKQIKKILKKSPKWTPAQKDGIPVRAQYTLPLNIRGITN